MPRLRAKKRRYAGSQIRVTATMIAAVTRAAVPFIGILIRASLSGFVVLSVQLKAGDAQAETLLWESVAFGAKQKARGADLKDGNDYAALISLMRRSEEHTSEL